ncbi:MAG TPA: FtsW/RodA/SpoVE family cell cycle protein, partial [Actinomycetota bacterium]|nr:FtsW/RodA/SpoVE family cell cycle protein [Actinomycetota bacterium]
MRGGVIFGEAVDRIGGEPIGARMRRKAPVRHVDPMLLLVTLMLASYGALMVFSATIQQQIDAQLDESFYLKRQIAYVVVGLIVMLVVSFFDYRYVRAFAPFVYAATILGLLIVLTPLGEVSKGASRWINLGFFQMQPS